jgi:hypothetical protein
VKARDALGLVPPCSATEASEVSNFRWLPIPVITHCQYSGNSADKMMGPLHEIGGVGGGRHLTCQYSPWVLTFGVLFSQRGLSRLDRPLVVSGRSATERTVCPIGWLVG